MKIGPTNSHLDNKETIIFVIGNEKGGAGKTTTAMHLISTLLCLGFSVASIDADIRQRSLTRYVENRTQTAKKVGVDLKTSQHFVIPMSKKQTQEEREAEEASLFNDAIETASNSNQFIVIDTPGSSNALSSLAHSYADVIITPMNDSFIDMDVIAKVNDELVVEKPSHYSQMVWEYKMKKASRNQGTIDWVILRNRLSHIDAKNKHNVNDVLDKLSQRLGFRYISGFSERVIFRELFLQGLTLLDLNLMKIQITTSHIAARQELRSFLKSFLIKKIDDFLVKSDLMFKSEEIKLDQPA